MAGVTWVVSHGGGVTWGGGARLPEAVLRHEPRAEAEVAARVRVGVGDRAVEALEPLVELGG
eukprot:5376466-Prymnesium_polylepis.1